MEQDLSISSLEPSLSLQSLPSRHFPFRRLISPVPLTEEEMKPLGIQDAELHVDFAEGDTVMITGGVWL